MARRTPRGGLVGHDLPFNITAETATLRMFTRDEVEQLLLQHTDDSGQPFGPAAVEHIHHLFQGHPWLVNALAAQVVHRDVTDRDQAVTAEQIERAKETLIVERRRSIASKLVRGPLRPNRGLRFDVRTPLW